MNHDPLSQALRALAAETAAASAPPQLKHNLRRADRKSVV